MPSPELQAEYEALYPERCIQREKENAARGIYYPPMEEEMPGPKERRISDFGWTVLFMVAAFAVVIGIGVVAI